MKKLANISRFESLKNAANRSMGIQSEMSVFNFDDMGDSEMVENDEEAADEEEWDEEEEDEGFGERPPKFDVKRQKELEDEWNVHNYMDMMKKSDYVLANFMEKRIQENYGDTVDLVSGRLEPNEEIYQYFLIADPWFIENHTYEPLFYDDEWDVYILGVTHFGTMWTGVEAPQLR